MTTLDGVTKKKQAEVLTVGLHRVLGRLARRAVNQKVGEPLRCRDHVVATPVRILTSVEFPRFPGGATLVHQRAVQPAQGARLQHLRGRNPRLREPPFQQQRAQ